MTDSIETVGTHAGEIALMATEKLKAVLDTSGSPDTKTARDLSTIIKDMVALHRDIGGGAREVQISFSDETAAAAR